MIDGHGEGPSEPRYRKASVLPNPRQFDDGFDSGGDPSSGGILVLAGSLGVIW